MDVSSGPVELGLVVLVWAMRVPVPPQVRAGAFTQGSTVAREEKARRARRKREGGVQLVIREQLLRPAFSVLLGENNSIKGTRGPMITEWGARRQLPAWLWKPFQILKELPHIMCCSCWDHLGEMQNLAPTDPSGRKDSRITPMFSLDEFQSHLPPLAFFATEPSHSSSCISLCLFFFQVGLQRIKRKRQFPSLKRDGRGWGWSRMLGDWVGEARVGEDRGSLSHAPSICPWWMSYHSLANYHLHDVMQVTKYVDFISKNQPRDVCFSSVHTEYLQSWTIGD